VLISLLLITTISCFIYAESTDSDISDSSTELPKIILERDWVNFNLGTMAYQYLDGTLLKYKDVRSIISEVPQNNVILRDEKIWATTTIVSSLLLAGSMIAWSVYDNYDLPHGTIIEPIAMSCSLLFLTLTAVSSSHRKHSMRNAINRYNLYIQNLKI
jgi:hypothetical protein